MVLHECIRYNTYIQIHFLYVNILCIRISSAGQCLDHCFDPGGLA
jgi:hypothetical protein